MRIERFQPDVLAHVGALRDPLDVLRPETTAAGTGLGNLAAANTRVRS
jgi:hypothetical protein